MALLWQALLLLLAAPACLADYSQPPLFFMYEGEAFHQANLQLLECYESQSRIRNDSRSQPWDDAFLFAEHMTEIWVHRALMDHPQRTLDPTLASLFYVPAYIALSYSERVSPKCGGLGHDARMAGLIGALRTSQWFQRRGGADHLMVCATMSCRLALTNRQREFLGRIILGNLEPNTFGWAGWGCSNRVVTVPYAARSDIRRSAAEVPPSQRGTFFFFRGSGRENSGRDRLPAVAAAFPDRSDIVVTSLDHQLRATTSKVDDSYPEAIVRSRMCFAPKGDSPTSRRIYDAIAAGCIPVMGEGVRAHNLAFSDIVPYDEFAFFLPKTYLETEEALLEAVNYLASVPDEKLDEMHAGLMRWRPHLVVADRRDDSTLPAPSFQELPASLYLADDLLKVAWGLLENEPWSCRWLVTDLDKIRVHDALIESKTYPAAGRRDEWQVTDEAKVFPGHDLLLCSVPGAGAAPLAAALALAGNRTDGSGGGSGGGSGSSSGSSSSSYDDAIAPFVYLETRPLPLPLDNPAALRDVFSMRRLQTRVVRDPVTRLLALFLEDGWGAAAVLATGRSLELDEGHPPARQPYLAVTATAHNAGAAFRTLVAELTDLHAAGNLGQHAVFRQQSAYCGARYRHYSATLPRETLRRDGEALLRTLGLWEQSGWGEESGGGGGGGGGGSTLPAAGAAAGAAAAAADAAEPPARGALAAAAAVAESSAIDRLFAGCAWAHFFQDDTLDAVERLYAEDYRKMSWYSVDHWRRRRAGCCRAARARAGQVGGERGVKYVCAEEEEQRGGITGAAPPEEPVKGAPALLALRPLEKQPAPLALRPGRTRMFIDFFN